MKEEATGTLGRHCGWPNKGVRMDGILSKYFEIFDQWLPLNEDFKYILEHGNACMGRTNGCWT